MNDELTRFAWWRESFSSGIPDIYIHHKEPLLLLLPMTRTREESQKRHEERQSRAQNKREQLAEAKANRLTLLHEKVETLFYSASQKKTEP